MTLHSDIATAWRPIGIGRRRQHLFHQTKLADRDRRARRRKTRRSGSLAQRVGQSRWLPGLLRRRPQRNTVVQTCTAGFRTGSGGNFTAVGGTSVAAPTFSAILALINQYVGNTPPAGLGNVSPSLYTFSGTNPTAFHDVTTGNNIVPCNSGTPNCPATVPFQFGFSAGVGYDQVTGLGSVDGLVLANAWLATLGGFTLSPSPSALTASAGQNSNSTTITIAPVNGFSGTVTFTCSAGLPTGATCNFTTVNATSSTLVIQTAANMAPVSNVSVTVTGRSGAVSTTTTVSLTVTATTQSFSLTSNLSGGTLTVAQGKTSGAVTLTVNSTTGFIVTSGTSSSTILPVTYTCSGLPSQSTCNFSPSNVSSATSVSFTVFTTPPTTSLLRSGGNPGIFYAVLLPGLFGIMFTVGSRRRSLGGMRLLGLIVVLGFSTLWLGSCGNSSGATNPGTPKGTSTVTVNATTGGSAPITASPVLSFTLTVN